jgi:DNA anti-recombination protein RmuC
VAEGVQEIAGNELRLFAEEMRAISVTLKSAGKDIEVFGENYSHQIKQIDAAFEERLEKAGRPLDNWVEKLQADLKISSEALDENLKVFSKQMTEASQVTFDNHQEANADIQKSIESVTASFETVAGKLSDKLTEQLNISEKYQSSFQEMLESLTTNSQNFAQLTDNFVSSIKSSGATTEVNLKKFNESISDLKEAFEKQKDDLENIVNSVSEMKIHHQTAQVDKEQEVARLTAKLAEITTKLEENLSGTKSQLNQAFDPLVKELATLTSKIERAGEVSETGVFSKFFRG